MGVETASDEYVVNTVCSSHCGGTCEIRVHVRDGKIVRLEGVGDEVERGHRACARGRAYRQRVYAPDRLLFPLKRVGPRGAGEFTRVSWDEALDTVAHELKRVKETWGNAAILHFCSMCDPFVLHHVQAFHRLLCQFGGYTAPWGTISNEGLNFASGTTYGTRPKEHPPEAYAKSSLIIMWSWNPVTTQQGAKLNLSFLEAKANGAQFIAVDPRYSDSAAVLADRWIPIRPSTDTAMLVAMAYVIVTENLYDREYVEHCTFGFDAFRAYLLGAQDGIRKTPEWAEANCGVPAATIAELARAYAREKSAIIGAGYAAGRTAYGEQFHRAVFVLEAITGKTEMPSSASGVGAAFSKLGRTLRLPSPPNEVEEGWPGRGNALPYRGTSVNSSARVNVSSFADAILKGKAGGYPTDYKLLWLSNTNYLNQLGEVNKTVRALRQLEFILVTEQFMTASARFADIVLPVCTYLERNDLMAPGTSANVPNSYGLVNKVIEPLGESRSQLDICTALAPRLGIFDYNDKTDEEWVRLKVGQLAEELGLPDYETLRRQGLYQIEPEAAGAKQREPKDGKLFPTPSGKIEIDSQTIAAMNERALPSVPTYIQPWESVSDPLAERYPLQLITPHHRWRAHSQFANLPWLQPLEPQALTIGSGDAEARGIRDGDTVRVFNERGEMIIRCRVTERIKPGVVAIPQGAWYSPDEQGADRGGCSNMFTKNVTSPAGAFVSNTALVQVERVQGR